MLNVDPDAHHNPHPRIASHALRRLIGAVIARPPAVGAQQEVASDSAIRAIIRSASTINLSTGIVVGLFGPTGRRRVVAYGSSGTTRPSTRTASRIGSITKTLLAAIADMVARGGLRPRRPGGEVPSRRACAHTQWTPVTLAISRRNRPELPYMPSDTRRRTPRIRSPLRPSPCTISYRRQAHARHRLAVQYSELRRRPPRPRARSARGTRSRDTLPPSPARPPRMPDRITLTVHARAARARPQCKG